MKTRMVCIVVSLLLIVQSVVAQEPATASGRNPGRQELVRGEGKKDYVPLWLGRTKLGNSSIFQTNGNVGIGTTSPQVTLDVNGAVNAATGFNLGGTPFAFGSYSNANAFLGFSGNTSTSGVSNTANGEYALVNNTTGSYNTADGYQSLEYNTTGDNNTADGDDALNANTTGNYNTASGYQALATNTTGSNNTADGTDALVSNSGGNYNTASGYQALASNTTGYGNTAGGFDALVSNTTGGFNTALGYQALSGNTTGSYLACVGYDCTAGAKGIRNATAIGAHAVVGASNALVLGGTGEWAVKVGIGTATPSNVLTIAQGAGHPVSDGWETFSSRRWKTNIQTLHGALGKVEQLRGVSYDQRDSGKHEVGVIAEEVGAVVPEVVTYEENGKDAQSVDYSRLTALLIEATKEQQAVIRKQQAQIEAQRRQIIRLASQVRGIQASLKTSGQTRLEIRTVKAQVPMTQ